MLNRTYPSILMALTFPLLSYFLYTTHYILLLIFLAGSISILLDNRTYLVYALSLIMITLFKGVTISESLIPVILSIYYILGYFKPFWISSISIPLTFSSYFIITNTPITVEFSVLLIVTLSMLLLGLEVRSVLLSGIIMLVIASVAFELKLITLSNQLSNISYFLLLTGVIGIALPSKVNVNAGLLSAISAFLLLFPTHEYSLIFLSIGISSLFPPLAIIYAISLSMIYHSYYLLSLSLLYPLLRYVRLTGFLPFSLDLLAFKLGIEGWLIGLIIGGLTGLVYKKSSWSYIMASVSYFALSYALLNSISNVLYVPFITLGYSLAYLVPNIKWLKENSIKISSIVGVALISYLFLYLGIYNIVYFALALSLSYFLWILREYVKPFLSFDLTVFLTLSSPFVVIYSFFVKWKYKFALAIAYILTYIILLFALHSNFLFYELGLLLTSASTIFPNYKWKYSYLLPGALIVPYSLPISFFIGYLMMRKKKSIVDVFLLQLVISLLFLIFLICISPMFPIIVKLLQFLKLLYY